MVLLAITLCMHFACCSLMHILVAMQRLLLGLLLVSVVSATVSTMTLNTYNPHHLKRVFLQHLIRDGPSGQQNLYAAASSDATDVSIAVKHLNLTLAESDGKDWLVSNYVHLPSVHLPGCRCNLKLLDS